MTLSMIRWLFPLLRRPVKPFDTDLYISARVRFQPGEFLLLREGPHSELIKPLSHRMTDGRISAQRGMQGTRPHAWTRRTDIVNYGRAQER